MQDKTKFWHLRLRHISERGLVELGKQNLLGGDSMEELEFCVQCVLGKSHRLEFEMKLVSIYSVDRFSMLMQTCGVQHELRLMVEGLISSPS